MTRTEVEALIETGEPVRKISLAGVDLSGGAFLGRLFDTVDFSDADLHGATLELAQLLNCNLAAGAVLTAAKLDGATIDLDRRLNRVGDSSSPRRLGFRAIGKMPGGPHSVSPGGYISVASDCPDLTARRNGGLSFLTPARDSLAVGASLTKADEGFRHRQRWN